MKKTLAAAAALSISLFSVNAYAQTDVSAYINDGGVLCVSVSSDVQDGALYTVYLSSYGTDLNMGRGTADVSGLLKIEQMNLGTNDGNTFAHAVLSTAVSELTPGEKYTLTIGGGELSGKTINLVYPQNSASAVDALKSADAAQLKQLLQDGQDKYWTLDFDNEIYAKNADAVCANMAKVIAESPDKSVNEWFDTACALTHMRSCTADEVFALISKYDPIFGTDYANSIKTNRSSIAAAFVNLRSTAAASYNTADYAALVHSAQALGTLNDAVRDEVLTVLQSYNDVFKLDFDGDYAKVDSYAVVKALTPGDAPYTSITAVQNKFNTTVAALLAGGQTGGTTTGSGGGGGGKGITGSTMTPGIVEGVDKTPRFSDISEAEWARPYIVYLQDRDIMTGDGDGKVRPNDNISREEFVKLLLAAFSISADESVGESAFNDVDTNEWYAPFVTKAAELGIVNGESADRFGIGAALSRQDCAVMICRTADSLQKLLPPVADETEFTDNADIADYARSSAKTLQKAGVISGYESGEFLPNNPITRAETAKMIYSVLKSLGRI